MSKDILHMKIDSEIKREAKEKASEDNRTLGNLVETVLKDFLKKSKDQNN